MEAQMIGRILFSVVFAIGIVHPMIFIKITEFWRIGQDERNKTSVLLTRVMSAIALVLIWVMPLIRN